MHLKTLLGCSVLLSCAAAELKVAIYGGGVASATLAQALKNYDHISVEYYDPALNLTPTSFRLLGLSPNAWTALDLLGKEAGGVINRAGWYPEDPSLVIMVSIHTGLAAALFLHIKGYSRAKARTLAKSFWTMRKCPLPTGPRWPLLILPPT